MSIEDRIARILTSAGSEDSPLRPTELYNEGWVLRLALDWCFQNAVPSHPLYFLPGTRWCSEPLLRSQFRPRCRGDTLGESWTHADGVIGHFAIGDSGRADLVIQQDALQLVVVEAKLFSPLSAGTKNAPTFDQAARTVACIAELLNHSRRRPEELDSLAFFVAAPREQIEAELFWKQLSRASLESKVQERVRAYEGDKDNWFTNWFEPTLHALRVDALAWEDLIAEAGPDYEKFYQRCLEFNRPS